ncbi:methyltransferase [Erythrobacter sp.]|uniref:methyltransferase n=1 Tax=Erythrobacter sp. TaxID=1042 RepID=UPI001425D097|nr:methyltransferase [Erythrobacter sp.]QIQ86133.1 MAG: methyltransferase [Erythrobacter sp.]
MASPQVPRIFSPHRRALRLARALARQRRTDAARFVWEDMASEMVERLAFVRHEPSRTLVIGPCPQDLSDYLTRSGARIADGSGFDLEAPFPETGFDFIAVLGELDAVNDLPGALIHLRGALEPGGLVIASFVGGQSLPALRAAMLAAEPDRPAARMHPLVDHRAAPGLLQRAGWKDPVVDTQALNLRYSALDTLVSDLRDQALGSALADAAPPLGRAALARARAAFLERADADGKVPERIEIVTLTGRRSLAGT